MENHLHAHRGTSRFPSPFRTAALTGAGDSSCCGCWGFLSAAGSGYPALGPSCWEMPLVGAPCVASHFLAGFRTLSLSFGRSDHSGSLGTSLFILLSRVPWVLGYIHAFHPTLNGVSHCFFSWSRSLAPLFPLCAPMAHTVHRRMAPHESISLYSPSFNICSYFASHSRISIVLPLRLPILSSACSNLLMNSSGECSISVIVLSSSRIHILFFLRFSIYTDVSILFTQHFLDILYIFT